MKYMMIGRSGCGKTTLCQVLDQQQLAYKKTQAVELIGDAIDTPGEYLERRSLYSALMVTAADADLVLILQDATDEECRFAPAMGSMFQKPLLGVITKTDLAAPEQLEKARTMLELAGASPIFCISNYTKQGIPELKTYLLNGSKMD